MNPEGYTQNRLPLMIILALEINTGLVMNAFIIFVVYRDFIKTKKMSSSSKILVCLVTSHVCFGFLLLVGLLDYFFSLGRFTTINGTYAYVYLLLCTISSCSWFSASLAFFYVLKIYHFDTGCFSWVRNNIGSIVPWMLLAGLLLSLFNSVLSSSFFFFFSQTRSANTTHSSPYLLSTLSQSSTTFVSTSIINTILPFLGVFINTLTIVVSLKKHSQRMKNVQTSDGERLRSYQKVVSRMTQSLFFYGIFYIGMIVFYCVVINLVESGFWLILVVLASFTPVQAVLLVLANPKLKAAGRETFRCVCVQETVIA